MHARVKGLVVHTLMLAHHNLLVERTPAAFLAKARRRVLSGLDLFEGLLDVPDVMVKASGSSLCTG